MLRTFLLLVAITVLPSFAFAFDGVPEVRALAYWELPIGALSSNASASFGFRFFNTSARQAGLFPTHARERPPMADLKFTRHGLAGLYVHGINIAPRAGVLRAAEATGELPEVNWLLAGGVAALAAFLIVQDNKRSKPSPQTSPQTTAPSCGPAFPTPPAPGGTPVTSC